MNALGALIIVFWWVATWGLTDLIVEGWTRKSRVFFYTGLLAFVSVVFYVEPRILDRL
jgi:hypothetical protein